MQLEAIKEGELNASTAVKLFDDICDSNGEKLTKSAKRTRLRDLMIELYESAPQNKCTLQNGKVVPIVVKRKNEGRAASIYFNNVNAPQNEILQAFAQKFNITFKQEELQTKRKGELIAQEALIYFTDIQSGGKKVSGEEKLEKLHNLFEDLYLSSSNKCVADGKTVPIIVKRKGENNKIHYCLNSSENKKEVMQAFAEWVNCKYLKDKENDVKPENKKKGELTSRQCEKFFQDLDDVHNCVTPKDRSTKIKEWFDHIGNSSSLNSFTMPDGTPHEIVVYRQSGSQRCWCMNSSDERYKPFIIEKLAKIMGAKVELSNVTIRIDDNFSDVYYSMKELMHLSDTTDNEKERVYYKSYAGKIRDELKTVKQKPMIPELSSERK